MIIPYRFRSIIDADLTMLERWLKTPEVVRWWGDPAEQLDLLIEDLDDPLMRPFAYVQAYEAHAWPQVHLQGLPGGQVIDAFIGEPEMLGRGHGGAFLGLLASSFIREGAPLVAIDPDARNLRARRAFARAGFAEDAVVEAKQGMVVLMVFGGDAPYPCIALFGLMRPRRSQDTDRARTLQDFLRRKLIIEPYFVECKSLL